MSDHEVTAGRSADQEAEQGDPTPDLAPNADGTPPTPSRWRRRWDRVSHIYRTRVRTTTVMLVVVWVVCLILYLFSANHYGTLPTSNEPQRAPATTSYTEDYPTVEPTTAESVPSTGSQSPLPSGQESSQTTPESTTDREADTGTVSSQDPVAPTGSAAVPTSR